MRLQKNTTNHSKMVGISCSYIPEEIIIAAGLTPYRIWGSSRPPELSTSCLPSNFCPYVLSCLDLGLQGDYNFLSGLVIANSCNAMRRLYDVWRYYLKTPFVHMLDIPKIKNKESEKYFKQCLENLIEMTEEHYMIKITKEDLITATTLCNETRSILKEIYFLKKKKYAQITNQQIYSLIKESLTTPKANFNIKANNILAQLKNNIENNNNNDMQKIRVLITGSFHDPSALTDMIEGFGAEVVFEDICTCGRHLYSNATIDITSEPIGSIAKFYLNKPPCARMIDTDSRLSYLLSLINEYKVDGVVYYSLKFCDTHLLDFPYLRKKLLESGIPTLFLEGSDIFPNSGQIKTRIEAFLELFDKKYETRTKRETTKIS